LEDIGIQKIILDNQGNIYCSGYSESTDFPLQDNGTFFQDSPPGYIPFGFILKFDENGNQLWGTGIVGTTNPTG
jgi:hypothetical protein